jgi:hypothetical protein
MQYLLGIQPSCNSLSLALSLRLAQRRGQESKKATLRSTAAAATAVSDGYGGGGGVEGARACICRRKVPLSVASMSRDTLS